MKLTDRLIVFHQTYTYVIGGPHLPRQFARQTRRLAYENARIESHLMDEVSRRRHTNARCRGQVALGLVCSVVLSLGVLSGCAAESPAPRAAPMSLMPLGDSITEGNAVPGGYRINLWKQLVQADGDSIDFVGSQQNGPPELGDMDHEGHPGWRIDELRAQVDGWLRTSRPDAVLLHIGTNDIFQNYQLRSAPDRLQDLVSRICVDVPGVQLSVASIVPVPGRERVVDAYNTQVRRAVTSVQATGCDVSFVDMNKVVPESDEKNAHPTRAGYDKMAAAWYRVVSAMYAKHEK